jgi:hypothetical protein
VGDEASSLNSGGINCDQTVPDYDYASLGLCGKVDFARVATNWLSGRGHNYGLECYNDAVKHALANGIKPAFLLFIWLHESDASNYTGPLADFGVVGDGVPKNDWLAQITRFVTLPTAYPSYCNTGNEMDDFFAMFTVGDCNRANVHCDVGICQTVAQWIAFYEQQLNTAWGWIACDGSSPSIH